MSSGSSGVEKASVRAIAQLALVFVGLVLEQAQAVGRRRLAARPGGERLHPLYGDRRLLAQHPEHVGRLREKPVLEVSSQLTAFQITSIIAPRAAEAGRVKSQAKAIERTTPQRTWCQRRRPPPTPTTEEATTWVVETGAPR